MNIKKNNLVKDATINESIKKNNGDKKSKRR